MGDVDFMGEEVRAIVGDVETPGANALGFVGMRLVRERVVFEPPCNRHRVETVIGLRNLDRAARRSLAGLASYATSRDLQIRVRTHGDDRNPRFLPGRRFGTCVKVERDDDEGFSARVIRKRRVQELLDVAYGATHVLGEDSNEPIALLPALSVRQCGGVSEPDSSIVCDGGIDLDQILNVEAVTVPPPYTHSVERVGTSRSPLLVARSLYRPAPRVVQGDVADESFAVDDERACDAGDALGRDRPVHVMDDGLVVCFVRAIGVGERRHRNAGLPFHDEATTRVAAIFIVLIRQRLLMVLAPKGELCTKMPISVDPVARRHYTAIP